jgi:amphi-Trp domain-containing protein
MELLEVKEKQRVPREEAAARLRSIADALERHNDIEFDRAGLHFKLRVPDEIDLKVELEVENDGTELEIELTW